MDTSETQQSFVSRINKHVEHCQVCQQGTLCDTAERIIIDEEDRLTQIRVENQARKLRQVGN